MTSSPADQTVLSALQKIREQDPALGLPKIHAKLKQQHGLSSFLFFDLFHLPSAGLYTDLNACRMAIVSGRKLRISIPRALAAVLNRSASALSPETAQARER